MAAYTRNMSGWGDISFSTLSSGTSSYVTREEYERERRREERQAEMHRRQMEELYRAGFLGPQSLNEGDEMRYNSASFTYTCNRCHTVMSSLECSYENKPVCRNCMRALEIIEKDNQKRLKVKKMLHNLYFNKYRADRKV